MSEQSVIGSPTSEVVTVLLVEDNLGDARLIQEMLLEIPGARFDLECADRLAAGLERLSAGKGDVVLLDLSLPDSSGLDTFLKTQAHVPHVPIIVLTSLDDEVMALDAIQKGAQGYLVKDHVNSSILVRSIRSAIDQQRMLRETGQPTEARLRSILESSTYGFIVLDRRGEVRFVNASAQSMLRDRLDAFLDRLTSFPLEEGAIEELSLVDGSGATIRVKARMIRTSWENEGAYLVLLHDMVPRRQVEAQESIAPTIPTRIEPPAPAPVEVKLPPPPIETRHPTPAIEAAQAPPPPPPQPDPALQQALDEAQTQLRESQAQLRELQAREAGLRRLLEATPDGIVIMDSRGIVRFVNPAAEAHLNRKTDELVDKPFTYIPAGESREVEISAPEGQTRIVEMRKERGPLLSCCAIPRK
jgi:DNA-binding NarL/FixJ family response regulator